MCAHQHLTKPPRFKRLHGTGGHKALELIQSLIHGWVSKGLIKLEMTESKKFLKQNIGH